jgi:hypothetical protein
MISRVAQTCTACINNFAVSHFTPKLLTHFLCAINLPKPLSLDSSVSAERNLILTCNEIFVGKILGKYSLGRSKRGWEDNIKMNLRRSGN